MPVGAEVASRDARPRCRARVGRRLEPALGSEQVDAAVAVDVPRADSVPGRIGEPKVVLLEHKSFAVTFLHNLIPDDDVDRVGQDVRHAVTREVDHPGRFNVARLVHLVISPVRAGFAGILDPADVSGEIGARDEIGVAVAVDVQRQRREIVIIGAAGARPPRTW